MKNKKIYIVIIFLCLFILNTVLVKTGAYFKLDDVIHNIIFYFNSENLTSIMKIITFFGSTVFMVVFALILSIGFTIVKKNKFAYTSVSMLIISTILNNVIKFIIRRPRPEYIMVLEKSFSYPSGHMMASTTIYGFLIYMINKSNLNMIYKAIYSCLLLLLIILIGISRIYLGAHFFSDVFGGAILSTNLVIIFSLINDKKHFF